MNLIIDFGNTHVKAALFDGKELSLLKVFDSPNELLSNFSLFSNIKQVFIGTVTSGHEEVINALSKTVKFHTFTSQTLAPLKNLYQSVSTLGSDRLAASVGAYDLYPNQNVLVIDAGTCVKYNFTNSDNEYLGGAISPGLQMRFRAMKEFTNRLPLVSAGYSFNKLIGTTTEESLLSGVINGIIYEIDGFINDYKEHYPDLKVVLTGGDTGFFVNRLKNSIFAHPNLVLKGLNTILIYNS
jgi:type III pantothenate kinase